MEIDEFKAKLTVLGFTKYSKTFKNILTHDNYNIVIVIRSFAKINKTRYYAAVAFSIFNLSKTTNLIKNNPEKYELDKTYNEVIASIK